MMARLFYTVLFVTTLIVGTHGFGVPSPKVLTTRAGTERSTSTDTSSWERFATVGIGNRKVTDVPYGEDSRKFRRTVYTHDDWKRHRDPDRFFFYLSAIGKSGIYKNLGREVAATTAVATFICLWNALTGEYQDLEGVKHAGVLADTFLPVLGLPLAPFTLASPSLGLLLVFRTNTSYRRWDEARKNWGMNINHTRDLVRMANTFYDSTGVSPQQRQEDLHHTALCTWAFVRAMKRHLSPEEEDEEAFRVELYEKLPFDQAKKIIDAAHRPNRALQDLSYSIDYLPMHFLRKNEVQTAVTIFEDDLGSSERLLTSPVPLFYSRHTARFLYTWLLLLPFALYEPLKASWNHIAMIPVTAILSVFLFGIEELATQLEEPFTILPMQAFCDKIYNWCMEIMSWSPGDNGWSFRPIKPEHAYFAGKLSPPTPNAYYEQPPPMEFQAVESPPMESQAVEPPPVESQAVESPPVESQPVESPPVESQPMASQPMESQPMRTDQPGDRDVLSFEDFLKSQGNKN